MHNASLLMIAPICVRLTVRKTRTQYYNYSIILTQNNLFVYEVLFLLAVDLAKLKELFQLALLLVGYMRCIKSIFSSSRTLTRSNCVINCPSATTEIKDLLLFFVI